MSQTPRTPTAEQLDLIRADAHKAINAICDRWTLVAAHASDWQRGWPQGGADGATGHGVVDAMAEHLAGELSPPDWETESQMSIRRIADPGKDAAIWCVNTKGLIESLFDAERKAKEIVPTQPERKRETDIGKCECCERDVARTANDPLKGGLCRKCYEAWSRAKRVGTDRGTFMLRRRLMLGADLEAIG
jgi:hypothetical protein